MTFEGGSKNKHFQSTLLVVSEGVAKKYYPVYALDIVDNSGRTLLNVRKGTHFIIEPGGREQNRK